MASTISPCALHSSSLTQARLTHAPPSKPQIPKSSLTGRRNILFTLTAIPALTIKQAPSKAEDIPLFGLRKKLKKAEEVTEELVKEGFETAEKGIETAEKGIVKLEKEIQTAETKIERAEKAIETTISFDGLSQAGIVAGAEVLGVLIATSIVNGILGPEAQKS